MKSYYAASVQCQKQNLADGETVLFIISTMTESKWGECKFWNFLEAYLPTNLVKNAIFINFFLFWERGGEFFKFWSFLVAHLLNDLVKSAIFTHFSCFGRKGGRERKGWIFQILELSCGSLAQKFGEKCHTYKFSCFRRGWRVNFWNFGAFMWLTYSKIWWKMPYL